MDEYEKQNIGNYKGLMLCNRPNEEIRIEVNKPFISRVDPKLQLGLNPVQQHQQNKPIRSNQGVINTLTRHKMWLSQFKQRVREQKQQSSIQTEQQVNKVQKLRNMSLVNIGQQKARASMINQGLIDNLDIAPQVTEQQVENILNDDNNNDNQLQDQYSQLDNNENSQGVIQNNNTNSNNKINAQKQQKKSHKKNQKSKPQWAYTEEQYKQEQDLEEEEEVDDLLDFVNNLDYKQYIEDNDVKDMLKQLKETVDNIQVQNDGTLKNNNTTKQTKFQLQNNSNIDDVENRSVRSHQSKQSITSLREEAAKKQNAPENQNWDNSTSMGDRKNNIESKLVKHIADEILKNNRYLRNIHSNQSLRTLLEGEAQRQINEKKQNQKDQQQQNYS